MPLLKLEKDRLDYHNSQSDVSPIESKLSAILTLETPKTFKKLRFFLGSVRYIRNFIPNLAQISHPSEFIWTELHENFFSEVKNRIANATEKGL